MSPANQSLRYNVTQALTSRAHTQMCGLEVFLQDNTYIALA